MRMSRQVRADRAWSRIDGAYRKRELTMNQNHIWRGVVRSVGLPLLLAGGLVACDSKNKSPATPTATVTLAANPATLTLGAGTTLTWSSNNATGCTASGGWSGSRPISGSEVLTPAVAGAATYTLSCTGTGGSGSASTTVTVTAAPVPTVTLTATPESVALGGASTLTWSSTNAVSCTASGGWTGDRATAGTESVTPATVGAVTYTLQCAGAGGMASVDATVTATSTVPAVTGTIRGRVFNAVSGAPISGAVARSSGIQAVSNDLGEFTLPAVPVGDRRSVQVDAAGFETSYRIAAVTEATEATVPVQAVPVGVTMTVDPSAGADVQIPGSSAMVRFPAGSIAASAPVTVTLTDLQPAASADNMPGDYTTIVGASDGLIESFGALTVRLNDAAGMPINLRAGSPATLRIPVSSLNTNPTPTIPLWFYDTEAGRWVQEGTATLVVAGADQYYEGQVAHFTTWNADSLYDSILVTGCVSDRDQPVSGVSIKATGTNYTGTSSAVTGADGRFTIRVRQNSLLSIVGTVGGLVTSTRSVISDTSSLDLTGSCLQIVRDGVAFSVRLTWGATPSDLDSRIILPEGGQVSYENRGSLIAEPFVNLDTDDTSSFGPEVVTVIRPKVGTYRYFVNNYSRTPAPGTTPSPTRVELMVNGTLQLFTPPDGETASTFNWTVFDVVVAADCTATVLPASQPWTAAFPVPPEAPNTQAPFCSR